MDPFSLGSRELEKRRSELAARRRKLRENYHAVLGGSGPESRAAINNWNRERSSFIDALNEYAKFAKEFAKEVHSAVWTSGSIWALHENYVESALHALERYPRIENGGGSTTSTSANDNASTDYNASANGCESPANGCESPANGCESPANGCESAANGCESPANGCESEGRVPASEGQVPASEG